MRYLIKAAIAATAMLAACSPATDTKEAGKGGNDAVLHLLAPEYPVTYAVPTAEGVKAKMDTVLEYLVEATPMKIKDTKTGEELTDLSELTPNHTFDGKYRLSCYEWGVTYSAMLAAAKATGDPRYEQYVKDRLKYMCEINPALKEAYAKHGKLHPTMLKMVDPRALDDGGAIAAAMMKASVEDSTLHLEPMIDNYMDYVLHKEHRLSDGTFARNRPQHNTMWLDDMFMGVPSLAVMGTYKNDPKYYDEATAQIKGFAKRMFVPEKKLFRHGWVESMKDHPAFFWGRANGWAILTMCEVLDQLPENHPDRPYVLDLLNQHVQGLAALQGNNGLWHQLLDRNDTYGETSATAIYVYCLAHAINKGWIDAKAYGPVAVLGWNALADHIQSDGSITGTCVGTGMGFDPAFYAYRPCSTAAGHIYGPALWAGAEMINLINNQHLKSNDSAVHFYDVDPEIEEPIFELTDDNKGKLVQ